MPTPVLVDPAGNVQAVDVSHWQTPSDALIARIRAGWAVLAWIKVSQGARGRDVQAGNHWRRLRAAGLLVGAYHFYDFTATADANAANFVAAMRGLDWQVRCVLDVERGGASSSANRAAVTRCLDLIEAAIGYRPSIVYTYIPYWNASIAGGVGDRLPFIARYPNRYNNADPSTHPVAGDWVGSPAGLGEAIVWQWTSAGGLDRDVIRVDHYNDLLINPAHTTPGAPPMTIDEAALDNRLKAIEHTLEAIAANVDRKAAAVRGPSKDGHTPGPVWIVTEGGRWHVPDMETLNVLIFLGQVAGHGTDGIPELTAAQLDGIPELPALK